MRLKKRCFMTVSGVLLAVADTVSILGGGGVKASAALSGGRFMTTQEALATFGTSFTVKYFNGTEIVETVASYQNVTELGDVPSVAQTDYIQQGRSVLAYSFQGNISASPEQIQIDVLPEYSLFDIDQLHTVILTPSGATYITPYTSPQWVWMFGGVRTVFEGLSSGGEMYRVPVGNTLSLYVPVDWSSQSLTSGYSVRAVFSSGSLTKVDGSYWVYLGIPYITSDANGSQGTFTASGTTSTGSVNVDLEETNGLLGSIGDAIVNIYDILIGDYEPSEPYEPEAVETIPPLDYDGALDEMSDIMEEAPNITAAAGFWFALYQRVFSADALLRGAIVFCCLLSVISYVLWK